MSPKKYLRIYLFSMFSIWLTSQVISGFHYNGEVRSLAWITLIFLIAEIIIRPLANLLLLPINLLTLGIFRWVINVAVLYSVLKITPLLQVNSFYFPGFDYNGFIFPSMNISFIGTLIISSFTLSMISSFLLWLVKK